MDVANRLCIVRPAFLALGVAVKQSAEQRTCFVNSAEPRLPVEETAREFVLPVVQQIADEFFRLLPKIVVVDGAALPESWLPLGIAERRFYEQPFAAASTRAVPTTQTMISLATLGVIVQYFRRPHCWSLRIGGQNTRTIRKETQNV